MKPPPDVDELMWQLAESGPDEAFEEFFGRYPEHRAELMKRREMVVGLKVAKPIKAKTPRENFMPSPGGESSPPRLQVLGVTVLLMAGVVMATLGTLRFLESRQPVPVAAPTTINPQAIQEVPSGDQGVAGLSQDNSTPPTTPGTAQPGDQTALILPFEKPVTVVSRRTTLMSALNDVAVQAGITLESAPGMRDVEIELDYRDVPAIKVIQDLGRVYGFTCLQQTTNTGLLVPATDPRSNVGGIPGNGTSPAPTGGTENGGLSPVLPTPGGSGT
ncbi:MAG: hypothetical protein LCH41_06695 [Armatimonadetes bacterium]|nr:hypothetical protein [Armatimonadota bacterium]